MEDKKEKYSLYCPFCDQRDSGLRCNECVTIYLPNGNYYPSNFTLDPDVVASSALLSRLYDDKSEDKMVSHPDHYQTKSGLETIQVIKAFTDGLEGIEAVCTANVIKYICRWKKKNGLQDLKKAQWYLTYLINHVEKEEKGE